MPVGHNTLGETVSRLSSKAGIQGHKTNHFLRVTTATRLFHAGVDEQLTMKRTGHRSLDGVCLYKRVSNEQDREISEILNSVENIPVKKSKMEKSGIDEGHYSVSKTPLTLNISNCSNITISVVDHQK